MKYEKPLAVEEDIWPMSNGASPDWTLPEIDMG